MRDRMQDRMRGNRGLPLNLLRRIGPIGRWSRRQAPLRAECRRGLRRSCPLDGMGRNRRGLTGSQARSIRKTHGRRLILNASRHRRPIDRRTGRQAPLRAEYRRGLRRGRPLDRIQLVLNACRLHRPIDRRPRRHFPLRLQRGARHRLRQLRAPMEGRLLSLIQRRNAHPLCLVPDQNTRT
jgi:hypothetical protein